MTDELADDALEFAHPDGGTPSARATAVYFDLPVMGALLARKPA